MNSLLGGDWNMTGLFSHILRRIIPIDELIFFRGIETTNQKKSLPGMQSHLCSHVQNRKLPEFCKTVTYFTIIIYEGGLDELKIPSGSQTWLAYTIWFADFPFEPPISSGFPIAKMTGG